MCMDAVTVLSTLWEIIAIYNLGSSDKQAQHIPELAHYWKELAQSFTPVTHCFSSYRRRLQQGYLIIKTCQRISSRQMHLF